MLTGAKQTDPQQPFSGFRDQLVACYRSGAEHAIDSRGIDWFKPFLTVKRARYATRRMQTVSKQSGVARSRVCAHDWVRSEVIDGIDLRTYRRPYPCIDGHAIGVRSAVDVVRVAGLALTQDGSDDDLSPGRSPSGCIGE